MTRHPETRKTELLIHTGLFSPVLSGSMIAGNRFQRFQSARWKSKRLKRFCDFLNASVTGYLINSSELGSNARLAFDEADAGQAFIYVPAIVIAELFYLNEKKGKPFDFAARHARLVESKQFVLLSFHPNQVLDFDACATMPEMHDRLIVGAARRMKAKLLTRDKEIIKTRLVTTVW